MYLGKPRKWRSVRAGRRVHVCEGEIRISLYVPVGNSCSHMNVRESDSSQVSAERPATIS